jgi:hypothetical protein
MSARGAGGASASSRREAGGPAAHGPEGHAGFSRMSEAEAIRALYIDFEGQRDRLPVLLGVLRRRGKGDEPRVFQTVVDPLFEPAGPDARPLLEAIEIVVRRAERKDRRIVAWSEHELELVRGLHDLDPGLVARFEQRYANALGVARRWAARFHPESKPPNGHLRDYLDLVGYDLPADAAAGHVGDTIRAMRPTLSKGRPLTDLQRSRWARLLEHNRHDCAGMREVCLRATRELDGADRSRRRDRKRSKRG